MKISVVLAVLIWGPLTAFGGPLCSGIFETRQGHPDPVAELQVNEWDKSLGFGWQSVLGSLLIPRNGVLIEIAPGEKAKIAYGLQGLEFEGTIYLVEPSAEALGRALEKYRELLPKARVIGIAKTMSAALPELPRNADAVMANHPLDDMVLNESLTAASRREVFGRIGSPEGARILREVWEGIQNDPSRLEKSIRKVETSWARTVKALTPRHLVISQYKSGYFRNQAFQVPDEAAHQVLSSLKKRFPMTAPTALHRLRRQRLQPQRWLVSRLSAPAGGLPFAVHRLGAELFEQNWLAPLPVEPLHVTSVAGENPIGAMQISKERIENAVPAYADLQRDPLNIALNGNRGSGRAVYVGRNRNLKGVGRTSLATSDDVKHSNGALKLESAMWEKIASNMAAKNLVTSASPVIALYDRGDSFQVGSSPDVFRAAIIERLDESGALDRPTHLFAAQKPVPAWRMYRMAEQFGRQDAEKFLERILHGAWSPGNISTEGHMIDFDTIASVRGRHPQYTLTSYYMTNQFGNEYLGQLRVIKALSESPINSDRVPYPELERLFFAARDFNLRSRFPDYMGVTDGQGDAIQSRHSDQIDALVASFKRLAPLMYPDYASMAAWLPSSNQVSVFDFSRFMRFYPLLKMTGKSSREELLRVLMNEGSLEVRKTEYVPDRLMEEMRSHRLVVETTERLESVRKEALKFIEIYEEVMTSVMSEGLAPQAAANAYRVNEDRTYLSYGVGHKTVKIIADAYVSGEISPARFKRLMDLLEAANDRLPTDLEDQPVLVDLRIYREGWTAKRLAKDGTYREIIATFTKDGETMQELPSARLESALKNEIKAPVIPGTKTRWTPFAQDLTEVTHYRKLTLNDLDLMWTILGDRGVQEMSGDSFTKEKLRETLTSDRHYYEGIFHGEELLGVLQSYSYRPGVHEDSRVRALLKEGGPTKFIGVGLHLHPGSFGNGVLLRKSASQFIARIFQDPDVAAVWAAAHETNIRSNRILGHFLGAPVVPAGDHNHYHYYFLTRPAQAP